MQSIEMAEKFAILVVDVRTEELEIVATNIGGNLRPQICQRLGYLTVG